MENFKLMFNGYYKINNDKSMIGNMDKIKPSTLKDIDHYDNYAGRLKDNIIMVDFDDRDQANRMLKIVNDENVDCNVIQTTKGMHFYFTNTEDIAATINTNTLLGFQVDYKLGFKHAYSPLKLDGNYRTILKSVKKPIKLPQILKPLNMRLFNKFTHDTGSFYGFKAGDGRNGFLRCYIIYLVIIEKFKKNQVIELFNIINKYVFSEPITRLEFNTICRDESFDKIKSDSAATMFFDGKKFLHNNFAKYIRDEHAVVKLDHIPQIYIDGMYYDETEKFHGVMIKYIDFIRDSQRKEVLSYLKNSLITNEVQEAESKYILLNNGVYDLNTNIFRDVDKSMIFKTKINANYVVDAESEIVDKFMRDFTCDNVEIENLIWELIGYIMDRKQKHKVMFFLYGPRAHNAKSTFLQMLSDFIGETSISRVAPQSLGGQDGRFNKVELYGKLANVVDDVNSGYIENTGIIKSMVDGRYVLADRKNEHQVKFKNYATFVFAGNAIPKAKDKTPGWTDRLIIIPCNAYFPPKQNTTNVNMDELITTDAARSYVLKKSIEGYHRIQSKGFTEPQIIKDAKEEYILDSNTFLRFISENEVEYEKTYISELHLRYGVWCIDSDIKVTATASQIKNDLLRLGWEPGKRKYIGNNQQRYLQKVNLQLKIVL